MSRETIRARVAAARPGPWRTVRALETTQDRDRYRCVVLGPSKDEMHDTSPLYRDDAVFIALARQDIPALLAVADAAAAVSPYICSCGCLTDERSELNAALDALEAMP